MKKSVSLTIVQRFALSFYAFSILFETWDPFNFGIDYLITKISITIYILSTLFNFKTFYSIKLVKPFIIPLFLLFIIETITGYLHVEIGFNDYLNFPLFLNFILFLAISNHAIKDKVAIVKALDSYTSGCMVLAIFYILNIDTDYSYHGRLSIFGLNQNQLGINIAIAFVILLMQLTPSKNNVLNNYKLIIIIFIPIFISMVAATGSRSSVICLLLCILSYFLFKKTTSPRRKIEVIFVGIIISIGLWQYFSSDSILAERFTSAITEGDLSGRDVNWLNIMSIIVENPFFGVGRNGLAYETERIIGYSMSAHNVFIEILSTAGVIGLLFFMFFFLKIIYATIRLYRVENEIIPLILLVPIFVMSAVGHPLGSKIAFIVFAYIISRFHFLKIESSLKPKVTAQTFKN